MIPQFARLNRVPEGNEGQEGGSDGGGGSGGTGKDKDKDTNKNKDDVVSRADHERALADMHKYKKAAELAAKEKKDNETARLKETNDWKTLAEQKEIEAKEAVTRAELLQTSYVNDRKHSAIVSKCEALGIRAEAIDDLKDLDLSEIAIETTSTGKINVLGAERFAAALKARKPHWFSDKAPPKVNSNGTRVLESGDAITVKDLLKAEADGIKSGDKSKYYEMHKKFQQQRMTGSRR